ncbi:MAG TPA: helix-turn-helix domain-containing protein [Candidatus Hydrogenedentes bacterium]|nr:helix-turn-helix domain-containing protein [Candidatus Hydrogenedentota bacterium]
MAIEIESELLSVGEAAVMLRLGKRTLYRLADVGAIPRPVKVGRATRWRRRELQEWVDAGCPDLRRVGLDSSGLR